LGGWVQLINGHSKYIDQAKAFVKWLWIDNTTDQMDFNQSYGFHIPARKSLAAKATKLQSGPAAEAVQLFNQHTKILPPAWDTAMSTDLTTAVSNIVKNGADATAQVHTAAQQCAAELKTLLGS
jgi:multiple sugar transport system substrate-binding protein